MTQPLTVTVTPVGLDVLTIGVKEEYLSWRLPRSDAAASTRRTEPRSIR